ncbi:MAG: DUF1902 domain-containing protein [Xanthobacteraceae bacterium]|jgi:Domain of unknown function (DUF1902)
MTAFATSDPDSKPSAAPFVVRVVHDREAGLWIAINDDLPVATEAPTLDELIARVWEIAPEIAELNHIGRALRLRFVVDTEAASAVDG